MDISFQKAKEILERFYNGEILKKQELENAVSKLVLSKQSSERMYLIHFLEELNLNDSILKVMKDENLSAKQLPQIITSTLYSFAKHISELNYLQTPFLKARNLSEIISGGIFSCFYLGCVINYDNYGILKTSFLSVCCFLYAYIGKNDITFDKIFNRFQECFNQNSITICGNKILLDIKETNLNLIYYLKKMFITAMSVIIELNYNNNQNYDKIRLTLERNLSHAEHVFSKLCNRNDLEIKDMLRNIQSTIYVLDNSNFIEYLNQINETFERSYFDNFENFKCIKDFNKDEYSVHCIGANYIDSCHYNGIKLTTKDDLDFLYDGMKESYQKDLEKSFSKQYLMDAINSPKPEQFILVGSLYQFGIYVERDYSKALDFLVGATSFGNPEAAEMVFNLFFYRAVYMNYDLAFYFLNIASKLGANKLDKDYNHYAKLNSQYLKYQSNFEPYKSESTIIKNSSSNSLISSSSFLWFLIAGLLFITPIGLLIALFFVYPNKTTFYIMLVLFLLILIVDMFCLYLKYKRKNR